MLYKFFLWVLFAFFASVDLFGASLPSLKFFEDKPRCLAKDFYIYNFLNEESTTPQEAKALFGMVHTMNIRFFHLFAKKMDNQEYKKISKCMNLEITPLMKEDDECLNIGITIAKATSLPKGQLKSLMPRVKHNKELSKVLELMSRENVYEHALYGDAQLFLTLFNGSITSYKEAIFNQPIPKVSMDSLAKHVKFNAFVISVIQNDDLVNLQKSLLHVSPSSEVSAKALFYLGLNALKYDEKKQAICFFERSIEHAKKRDEKDRALFWQYLTSEDKSYLKKMIESFDVNIYTIYAHEKLDVPFDNIVSPVLEGEHPTFNVTDPFAWPKVMNKVYHMSQEEVEKEANKFKYANTLPHYSYLMERVMRYQKNFYPIPYFEEIKDFSIHRQALMLAIARQESRFLPSVVSTSYALGMMQFMPFVAKDIAKKQKLEGFSLDAMFDPRIAYLFGNIHLDFLERNLLHPLFIAYAYNGGIGFTKRHLLGGAFSKKAYEPFLSMETMINEESREYGKKVLANYIVYMRLLGEEVSLSNLFETLLIPSQSDRFRN